MDTASSLRPGASRRSAIRSCLLIVVGLGVITPAASGLGAQLPSNPNSATPPADAAVLDQVEQAAISADAWEAKGESAFSGGQSQSPGLTKARQRLLDFLRVHPNDVRALILQARVARSLIVVTPVEVRLEDSGGGHVVSGDTTKMRSDALAALDKVIALDPKNGDAYYWKARTLMLANGAAEQVGAAQPFDPAPAVAAARMAVDLAPANPTYREYLAIALFGIGQRDEARQHLARLPGKHPILQLLDDLNAIPEPAGAVADDDAAYNLVSEVFSGHLDAFRFPGLRVRVQTLPYAPARAKAFYAGIWPKLRWVKTGDGGAASAGLAWRDDTLAPIADPAPFTANFDKRLPPSGVLLVLAPTDETKPVRTKLFIVNFRQF